MRSCKICPILKAPPFVNHQPTLTVEHNGPVQISFFGDVDLGQVADADIVDGPRFKVASLVDMAGMKAAVVTQRAEVRDYFDIHALLIIARTPLATMLAAGLIIYGTEFNPLLSLKAISYHDDPSLTALPAGMRRDLIRAVKATDVQYLPAINAVRRRAKAP